MSRKILITGGAGFIGSNFLRYMFHRHPDSAFVVLDNLTYAGNPENIPNEIKESKRFSFWYGDVQNQEIVNRLVAQSDVVVHFAAESHVARSIFDNRQFFLTDVLGTQTVANAILNHGRVERYIHISTSEVYGTALSVPMTEDHPLNPFSPYAGAKAGADRLVYSYWRTYGIPAVILRLFNQYGPNQHLEKVIPRFISNALMDKPLTVHGDGRARRDWLYVEDGCERIDLALQAPIESVKGEVFNLGSGDERDVLSIARLVLKILGKPEDLLQLVGERPGQVPQHVSSTDKARRVLGVKPGRPFLEGLERTVEWYREHRAWWEPQLWMTHVPIKTANGHVEFH